MNVLVTGSAGFIGSYLVKELLAQDYNVIGVDNLNDYYDVELKNSRLLNIENYLRESNTSKNYEFIQVDISDRDLLFSALNNKKIDIIVNLAAEAGVRYSIENPNNFIKSNIEGFLNILELSKTIEIKHLLYASSSSIYGMNINQMFSENDVSDFPVSTYAATKKSNELMAHTYSHIYNIPTTGLRFFTIYGPNGRPDMAYFKFTKAILEGKAIDVYNKGNQSRDYTYIDDLIKAIMALLEKSPSNLDGKITGSKAPFDVYNIGNSTPVSLNYFIECIEKSCGKKAIKNLLPHQSGDVTTTLANMDKLKSEINFKASVKIEEGIDRFVKWYKEFYNV
tara:strand:- start:664 stop:1674 length:1011 start_codon:yes stop_codon:yes gene_type:complete